MNSFQTEVEPTEPTAPKPKPPAAMDELCECGDMLRNHVGGNLCGVFPCTCTVFNGTGKFHDWRKHALR